jgi:hypothetical protein
MFMTEMIDVTYDLLLEDGRSVEQTTGNIVSGITDKVNTAHKMTQKGRAFTCTNVVSMLPKKILGSIVRQSSLHQKMMELITIVP